MWLNAASALWRERGGRILSANANSRCRLDPPDPGTAGHYLLDVDHVRVAPTAIAHAGSVGFRGLSPTKGKGAAPVGVDIEVQRDGRLRASRS